MKAKTISISLILLAAVALLGGCTAYLADNNALLNRAGFRSVKAETPEQRQLLATTAPYKFMRGTARGGTFYVYKDELSHIAYVGLEGEYQRYQELARQE